MQPSRPGCRLAMPVAATDPDGTAFERAALVHDSGIRDGGAMSVETASELLGATGFVEVRSMLGVQQSLVMAANPSVPQRQPPRWAAN